MLVMQGMYSQLGIGYPLVEVSQNIFIILRVCHRFRVKTVAILFIDITER